ncbi:MAG: carbamoyltransferase C-terminal domain-containing protein, partial [Vicinamibacterales bacterium]
LERTALTLADIDRVTVVDDDGPAASGPETRWDPLMPVWTPPTARARAAAVAIDPVLADAIQVAASADDVDLVLICSTHPAAITTFVRNGERLVRHNRFDGGERLMSTAHLLATALGVSSDDPFHSLDRLSIGGELEFRTEMGAAIHWSPTGGVSVHADGLNRLLHACGGAKGSRLDDASSLNARVQQTRRSLAASFTHSLAQVVSDAAETSRKADGKMAVGLGGGMSANPGFNTELRQLAGDDLRQALVPEPVGRALGAALASSLGDEAGKRLSGLALGPAYTEAEIKRTLDNCRLDYVYEPDWQRLIGRVSAMLAQGKVVAWFQGAMAFGPRPLGSRSVLCDPSGRYARQNINEYLRHLPLDEPLPVAFAPSAVEQCLSGSVLSPPRVVDASVRAEWRDQLVSALDWQHRVRVQAIGSSQAPAMCELLECHFQRTGVPALIETRLGTSGEPVACAPRDAVRTVYSSAIDALVIGRFLLMKDYW